ncbi:glycoside hydrolase family 3 N-terminal domain-containing protein [Paraburkholderia fungorum]|uniref:beta-N-acetylhexosaminidase n=1 Tax=Paraburkholderia fungorum TaxID=134537 RepID=A0A420FF50_9BURK|nr:glycoside hydrolase family 3 N-terminal domain-containing protein [Paraburkholderia fungorum]RKF31475.1 glycoside hydrolase [Paraburkholderia fungorum]
MSELSRHAHAVLFPVLETLEIDVHISRFLDNGGRSLLFGETGEEYVSGRMSQQRLSRETVEAWHGAIEIATARAGKLILAADTDIAAVHRLQGVSAKLPARDAAQRMSESELEQACFETARGVVDAGINLALSPTAEVLTGSNQWLEGRTLANDLQTASRMVRSYIRGARRAGLKTTLKHFPGHPVLRGHPAKDEATVPSSLDELRAQWGAFRAGIEEGASAVMMGPARFEAFKPATAGSLSAELIALLRGELEFKGLVMTCDLDHRATIGDRSVGDTAVDALAAGADLLLLSPKAVPHIEEVAAAIVKAVEGGKLDPSRLDTAVSTVYQLADYRSV